MWDSWNKNFLTEKREAKEETEEKQGKEERNTTEGKRRREAEKGKRTTRQRQFERRKWIRSDQQREGSGKRFRFILEPAKGAASETGKLEKKTGKTEKTEKAELAAA